jgi:hypothetical protein
MMATHREAGIKGRHAVTACGEVWAALMGPNGVVRVRLRAVDDDGFVNCRRCLRVIKARGRGREGEA